MYTPPETIGSGELRSIVVEYTSMLGMYQRRFNRVVCPRGTFQQAARHVLSAADQLDIAASLLAQLSIDRDEFPSIVERMAELDVLVKRLPYVRTRAQYAKVQRAAKLFGKRLRKAI